MPQGVRATRLFVAGGDAKRTRGVTMTPQEPYLAPRACRFDDKRGYVKSSARVGDAEPMAASDVAFLAPELVSEAEGPVPVPAPAEGRLGYRFVKRAFDIAFSLCAIAVLLVPSIILCVAIRLESPGCPIYSQKRVGRIGRSGEVRTFDMYKFRSMHKDADERLSSIFLYILFSCSNNKSTFAQIYSDIWFFLHSMSFLTIKTASIQIGCFIIAGIVIYRHLIKHNNRPVRISILHQR